MEIFKFIGEAAKVAPSVVQAAGGAVPVIVQGANVSGHVIAHAAGTAASVLSQAGSTAQTAASHLIGATGQIAVPIIQHLSSYTEMTHKLTNIAREVIHHLNYKNVDIALRTMNSMLENIYIYERLTGFTPVDLGTTVQPQSNKLTNLKALQGQDLKTEYEHNKTLIINLLGVQKKLLENAAKMNPTQLNQNLKKIQNIINFAQQRNQDIMQECLVKAKARKLTRDQEKKIKAAFSQDNNKLNATRQMILENSKKTAQEVLSNYKPDLKHIASLSAEVDNLKALFSGQRATIFPKTTLPKTAKKTQPQLNVAHPTPGTEQSPILSGYQQATSHEKVLKSSGVERSPEEVLKINKEIKTNYPAVTVQVTTNELSIASNNPEKLCAAARTPVIYNSNEAFSLNAKNMYSVLTMLRQSQSNIPIIRIDSIYCPELEPILGEENVKKFMKSQGIVLASTEPEHPKKPKPL